MKAIPEMIVIPENQIIESLSKVYTEEQIGKMNSYRMMFRYERLNPNLIGVYVDSDYNHYYKLRESNESL